MARKNTISSDRGRQRALAIVIVMAAIAVALLSYGLFKLHELWLEQCVVTDVGRQVEVDDGKMIKGGLIISCFRITNGVNLAKLDYDRLRADTLRKFPQLRSITVRRRLPDGLKISIEEREPLVRLGISGKREPTGRVADSDGIVFRRSNGVGALPLIREPSASTTAPGRSLGDRGRAAMRLIEALQTPDFSDLGILEADISVRDFITVTFTDYARAKIAWDGMDTDSPASRANMQRQLRHLRDAIRSRVGAGATMWNATDTSVPGRIFTERKGASL